jgi:transcriptional regulator with XRE-family HTH domain
MDYKLEREELVTFARRIGDEDKRSRRKLREKLRQARTETKLTQKVVAYMLGCSQSYLSKVERTGRVDFVRMQRLAAIYARPIEWFQTLPDPFEVVEGERLYFTWPMADWEKLEKMRHWLVPRGWGRRLACAYGYVGKYLASHEYKRLMNGESFNEIFNKDFLEKKAADLSPNEKQMPRE